MSCYVLCNPTGEIVFWDEQPFPGSIEVDYEVVRGWDGKLYKEGTEPAQPEVVVDYKAEAQAALDRSDLVALRCFKAGVVFPAEWVAYCVALRGIVRTGEGPLPEQPAYPAGS